MQTARQNTPHLANPPGKTPRTLQVHWVGAFEPCCSFGMRPVHIANPSGPSRLLFRTGVRPLRVRPDYFSAQGSVPIGSVPTSFLHRGPSPSGPSRLLFRIGVRPLRVRPDYFSAQGSVPFGSLPTTFPHRGPSPSGPSRLLFCTGVRPLRVRPDYLSAQGSVPSGLSQLPFCTGVRPLKSVPTTFLHRGPSPQVCPDFYISASGITSPHIQSRREKTVIRSSISIIAIKLGCF
ncbi:hypothetical protein CRG98_004047 [Punica granatum]|uniref:Uncharacterized protein n=1 Tax=Punica granatum TaxID=22663 RepID=A0A2I0L4C0_PUNGR|nr:hypothetical protein CRG98_004047 [Punica granatum]